MVQHCIYIISSRRRRIYELNVFYSTRASRIVSYSQWTSFILLFEWYDIIYTFCGATTRIMHSDMSILFFLFIISKIQEWKTGCVAYCYIETYITWCSNESEYLNIYIIYTLCDLKSSLFLKRHFTPKVHLKYFLFCFLFKSNVYTVCFFFFLSIGWWLIRQFI